MSVKIVILIHLVHGAFALISKNVTVDGLGNVIGLREITSWTNRTIFTFRGIPFAQPPTGDFRFRPPVPITTWNGTLDATEFASGCPQNKRPYTPVPTDDEDCLTLNVYVPEVTEKKNLLPIMIWIHGGTFTNGYASLYEPHYLLEEDVILVVIQYRLGPLGLLCLQTDEIPGNVAFLDQIMAMQWVQDNIGYFGGDPDEVTLVGHDSGAASVNLHQFSPLSKGLFHRVIIQSGSAFSPWVMDYTPLRTAEKFGALVGCEQTNVTEISACFKGLETQTILDGFDDYLDSYMLKGFHKIGGHIAVIQTAGTQRFLEKDPFTSLARSEYTQMPMIGGTTKHDGNWAFLHYYHNYLLPLGLVNDTEFLTYNLTSLFTSAYGITDETGGVSQTMITSYFEDSQLGNFSEMLPGIIDMNSVLVFKAPVFRMLQANSRVNTSYLYTFGYFGIKRFLDSAGFPFETGVGHSDELCYLFPTSTLSDDDFTVARRMVSLWTSFAITGVPTADSRRWEPMNTAFGPYLIIEKELSYGINYLSEYTIASKEGFKAVDRSLAIGIVPKLAVIISTILFLMLNGCGTIEQILKT